MTHAAAYPALGVDLSIVGVLLIVVAGLAWLLLKLYALGREIVRLRGDVTRSLPGTLSARLEQGISLMTQINTLFNSEDFKALVAHHERKLRAHDAAFEAQAVENVSNRATLERHERELRRHEAELRHHEAATRAELDRHKAEVARLLSDPAVLRDQG